MKKRLTPASIASQKKWSNFPINKKRDLRKMLPDKDKDGVPNKFDCRPRNKRKQESFLSSDAAFLVSGHEVKLGKRIGRGESGEIYELQGNPDLIVKVPLGFINTYNDDVSILKRRTDRTRDDIENEAWLYKRFNMANKPLFIPTKEVNLGSNGIVSGNFTGLIRPKVAVVYDNSYLANPNKEHKITDAQLEELRRKVIILSHEGFEFSDGLQVGFDKAGRLIMYDYGNLMKREAGNDDVFAWNNKVWQMLLKHTGRKSLARYGTINKNEHY